MSSVVTVWIVLAFLGMIFQTLVLWDAWESYHWSRERRDLLYLIARANLRRDGLRELKHLINLVVGLIALAGYGRYAVFGLIAVSLILMVNSGFDVLVRRQFIGRPHKD